METIIKACIKAPDGQEYTGIDHMDVRLSALREKDVFLDPLDRSGEGFKTSEGRFVDRKEAAKIAKYSGQIVEEVKELCSYMLDLR